MKILNSRLVTETRRFVDIQFLLEVRGTVVVTHVRLNDSQTTHLEDSRPYQFQSIKFFRFDLPSVEYGSLSNRFKNICTTRTHSIVKEFLKDCETFEDVINLCVLTFHLNNTK